MTGNIAALCVSNFCKVKPQGMRSTKLIVALLNRVKGDQYGIPDFSCGRIDDGPATR